jgi:hypothetical protein
MPQLIIDILFNTCVDKISYCIVSDNAPCHLQGQIFNLGIVHSPICGRCRNKTGTDPYILCAYEALAEFRFCYLDEHFIKPNAGVLVD